MSNLTVEKRDGVLVVDSRLVADSLDIAHKNLLATVDKYQSRSRISVWSNRVSNAIIRTR